ncbi:MAG: hypothetical protein J6Q94_01080 [Clostridia bacterium]|nr:hypothetical protein [Clostridia bacterium]
MIKVEGYKAFHGVMKITPKTKMIPVAHIEADWLYDPNKDCWCGNKSEYSAEICTVVSDDAERMVPKKLEMIKPHIGKCECGSLIEKPKYRKEKQFCKWCGQAVDWK